MGVQWFVTVALLVAAVYSGARLVVAGRAHASGSRASDAVHMLMAAGLAAMSSPPGDPIPGPWWAAAFSLVTLGSLAAILRARELRRMVLWARHAVAASTMVYSFVAAGLAPTVLVRVLVAYFACCVAWWVMVVFRAASRRVRAHTTVARSPVRLSLARVVTPLFEAEMAACMGYMLVAMH